MTQIPQRKRLLGGRQLLNRAVKKICLLPDKRG
jgi:hypothetical protein